MKLEELSKLKIGDKVFVKGVCNTLNPSEIIGFDYKAIKYKYLWETNEQPKKAMYYDIERLMTPQEIENALEEIKKSQNFKMPKCPDCKKPIDKCKCTE